MAYIPPTVKRYALWTGESQIRLLSLWEEAAKAVGGDVSGFYVRYAKTVKTVSYTHLRAHET